MIWLSVAAVVFVAGLANAKRGVSPTLLAALVVISVGWYQGVPELALATFLLGYGSVRFIDAMSHPGATPVPSSTPSDQTATVTVVPDQPSANQSTDQLEQELRAGSTFIEARGANFLGRVLSECHTALRLLEEVLEIGDQADNPAAAAEAGRAGGWRFHTGLDAAVWTRMNPAGTNDCIGR